MADKEQTVQPSCTSRGYMAYAQLVPCSEGCICNVPVGNQPIIPIVFLPGIMGSNLRNPKFKKPVWEPDHGFSLWQTYKDMKGAERQTRLDSTKVKVYKKGDIDNGSQPSPTGENNIPATNEEARAPADALRDRGWGSVMASAYQSFMTRMQWELNHIFASQGDGGIFESTPNPNRLSPRWKDRLSIIANGENGLFYRMSELTDAEVKNLGKFRFEVWACGYNWMDSIADSADYVKDFIENTVFPTYEQVEKDTKGLARLAVRKVILVTHSMGGLVARSLCSTKAGGKGRSDLVLGVVSGTMPANGAGEAYTNMREGIQSDGSFMGNAKAETLGNSTATEAPVFSQCQGGLELLPFGCGIAYNPAVENEYLRIPKSIPNCLSSTAIPGEWVYWQDPEKGALQHSGGDKIYDEIYKCEMDDTKDDWHRLLPRFNMQYFNPAGILQGDDPGEDPRKIFNKFIDKVQSFHKSIVGYYHPVTYAFWSTGQDTSSTGEAVWELSPNTDKHGRLQPADAPEQDTGKGEYSKGAYRYTLKTVQHRGDGTVPRASWHKDLTPPDLLQGYCLLGETTQDPKGFSHQDAFVDARAQEASLYFLAKLVNKQLNELMKKEPKQ